VDIWTVPATGGEAVPITADPAIDWNPVWAPDGSHLYFASDRGGSMNIWRVAVDQTSGRRLGEPEPITTPAPFVAHLSIAADGRRIAYSSVVMTQNVQRAAFDPTSATVGSEVFDVTTGSRHWSSPDPSPDGQWVAFYSQTPEGHMHLIRSDGTQLRQLTGDEFIDRVPRWSPDGKWLAWFSNRAGKPQIWKIRADGSDLRQVTAGPGGGYFAWSPDGSRMAVTTLARDQHGITIVDPNRPWNDQQPRSLVLPPDGGIRVTSWSPDGVELAGIVAPAFGIGTYTLATGALRVWTTYGEWPTWLPDSRRLLFVSEGRAFYVLDTKTGGVRKVYSIVRDTLGPPRLTRDGRAMYFTRCINESDVWIASLQ
jgi:Tol biopolymer transport system component